MPLLLLKFGKPCHRTALGDIATVRYPEARPEASLMQQRMELVQAAISAVRTIHAELNISPSYRLTTLIRQQAMMTQPLSPCVK